MFSKFSIRNKLIALVSVLLIAPISLGTFAIYEMRAINESAQDTQVTWLPSIRQISELRVQAARYRAILRDHILISDEKKKASINKALDDRVKAYDLAISKYEPLISSAEERALFNQLGKLWQDYRNAANDVIAASAKGDFAKAVEINTDKATPPGRAMDDVLFKLVDLNEKGGATSA
ncbi:CHASE3 domain sensor protein [Nitrobacteraceae bacterium AZCC 1564]